jgi:hypothetical protein
MSKFGAVFLVPGFAGCELAESDPRTGKATTIWADINQITLQDGLAKMALSPDGVTPLPPKGMKLFPIAPLGPYYTRWGDVLRSGEAKYGYGPTIDFPWDWRTDGQRDSDQLVEYILHLVPHRHLPCNLIGHSTGGLLCRLVWWKLNRLGKAGYVRRVITIGCPHRGSYVAMLTLNADNSYINRNMVLGSLARTFASGRPPLVLVGKRVETAADCAVVFNTFPSLYGLLPSPKLPNDPADPYVDQVYDKAFYDPRQPVSQAWLDWKRDVVDPFLLDPDSMPPPWVLTTIWGSGEETPFSVLPITKWGGFSGTGAQSFMAGTTSKGDGTVLGSSARVPGAAGFQYSCAHADQPNTVVAFGTLQKEIIEERTPQKPVVQRVEGLNQPATLDGPPFPLATLWYSGVARALPNDP